jgi:hypothetical protein
MTGRSGEVLLVIKGWMLIFKKIVKLQSVKSSNSPSEKLLPYASNYVVFKARYW